MEQQRLKLCPLGIQTFSEIIDKDYLYIDKTEYVWRMAHGASKYVFLSRPRRFGKSLLTSTMRCYFEGRKELFHGLAIEQLETEWTEYPVLHFDMSLGKHMDKEGLERYLGIQCDNWEQIYGRNKNHIDVNTRVAGLIRHAYEKTGKQVVVLIDEYDAPLLDVVHEEENLPALRNVMRNFYSPLKACDPYLRFVFLTGITKFSQLSIFSELNNIQNISMDEEYSGICGITKEELVTQMDGYIERLAEKLEVTKEEALLKLKAKYDGYHFTWPSSDIYNPYSLLNALERRKLDNYWFGSGTPTYLIEMLDKFGVIPQEIGNRTCVAEDFDAPTERMTDITPLLYQSGYITIKDYSPEDKAYLLDIPNREVRVGLMRSLMPNYVKRPSMMNTMIVMMWRCIRQDDMDGALREMQTVFSTVPYCDNTNYEGHYQQMLYLVFSLIGFYDVGLEVRTPKGRVDVVLRTKSQVYIIELKLNKSAREALDQIVKMNYAEKFAIYNLPITAVGINFDTEERNITEWEIVTL